MNKAITIVAILAVTAGVLFWPKPTPKMEAELLPHPDPVEPASITAPSLTDGTILATPAEGDWFAQIQADLLKALEENRYVDAITLFESSYDRATSSELDRLKALILSRARQLIGNDQPTAAIQLLQAFSRNNEDLNAWAMLAVAYRQTEQWQEMLTALLRSNRLEVDPQNYAQNLVRMVNAASRLATQHEREGDRLAVMQLYQALYEEYPQYTRFQFDLAKAHLGLGSIAEARSLLEGLIYDPELGQLAAGQLGIISQLEQSERAANVDIEQAAKTSKQEIVVPLIRSGGSLLVDANIDGGNARMLLDTGASITSLSRQQIQRLGLEPLDRVIHLSTANGTTVARLFRADRLTLGRVNFRDLVVAEIDLGESSTIAGLLGTDVLSRMNGRYNYLIDDQRSALVFELK